MKRSLSLLLIIGFIHWNCVVKKSENIAGLYYHDEEKCSLQLNNDSTFHFINVPNDIDNCFFKYRKDSFVGTWQLQKDALTLYFDSGSYCKLFVLGSGNGRRIRLKTKADSDLTIDLTLTNSTAEIR